MESKNFKNISDKSIFRSESKKSPLPRGLHDHELHMTHNIRLVDERLRKYIPCGNFFNGSVYPCEDMK